MKRFFIIAFGFFALVSCNNNGRQDGIDNQTWYDSVFTDAVVDTAMAIPVYAFSTDWMQRYVQYIKEKFELREDMLFGDIDGEPFDCRYWTMAYVDGDTIPELLLYGGCRASGTIILTQYNGEVYASPKGCFSYIKDADGLLHSQWKYGDDVWGEIYKMEKGVFAVTASYSCNTDLVDTSDVDDYELTLDSLKCHYADGEIGDSAASVSEIELNGNIIGDCFGIQQYASCQGFSQIRQTLDSLYYSHGTSTYFPFPSRKLPIEILALKSEKR